MANYPWLKSYPEEIKWDATIDPRPLYSILDETTEKFPWHNAIDFFGKRYSYSYLLQEVNRAAEGLQKLGAGKGVNIGIYLPNCPQYIISYFAILKTGATVVNFSPLYSEPELSYQLENSQTKILITLDLESLYAKAHSLLAKRKFEKLIVSNFASSLPFLKSLLFSNFKKKLIAKIKWDESHIKWDSLLDNEQISELPEIDPHNDIAVLQYTGGTTGTPKGAMLTHYNVYANTLQCRMWFADAKDGEEKMMGVLPFFHVFAMTTVMNFSIVIGAEIILHPRFEIEKVLKDINNKKPTLMPGVPTMYTAINNHPGLSKYSLRSLKACISGGAPLPVEVKQKFEELTECKVVEGYGLTECSPVVSANPLTGKNKPGSIGMPLPGTMVEIEEIGKPRNFMPTGQKGELCVRGAQVMKGYWCNRQETINVIDEDNRLKTGDVAYIDEDGYIFIVDRIKELILSGGFNIYPRNVEEAIYRNEAVMETAVIGVPDEYHGQVVKAFVVLNPGFRLTPEELKEFLKTQLGKHELPAFIEFRDSLPKTMVGKIDKKQLKT